MFTLAVGLVFGVGNLSGEPIPVQLDRKAGFSEIRLAGQAPFHRSSAAIRSIEEVPVPGPTRVFTWTEQTKNEAKPFYAITLDGKTFPRVTPTSYDVELKYARFDPLKAVPPVEPDLASDSGNELYIVQFKTQPLQEYRDALEALGVTLYDYFTQHCMIVRIHPGTVAQVRDLPFVRWLGTFEPAYRLEQPMRERLLAGNLGTRRYNIQVFERGGKQHHEVASLIELFGGKVDQIVPEGFLVVATLNEFQLLRLVRLNQVHFVDEWSELYPDMDNMKIVGGANYIADPTRGMFRGQGVRAEVFDTGFRLTHLAFNPNAPIQHNAVGNDSHGTATYGICFGDGDGNAAGQGLMPLGQGVVGASSNFLNANTGNRYAWTAALLGAPYYCVFQTNSTGSSWTTSYTTISATMDDIEWLNDIVILQSQSNQGTRNSRPEAWAKNVVAVGAAYHYNNANVDDDRWSSGASIGPAADGRVKPELYFPAYDMVLTTTSSSDTAYTTSFGGTSAATPVTAGHFGLMFQMFSAGIFGNSCLAPVTPAERFVFDNRPKPSLARAIMINTATQVTLPLTGGSDINRNVQGWGRANVATLYDRRERLLFVNETDLLQNLQTKTYRVHVPAGEPYFKATMVYVEPMGSTSGGNARKNDLSLRVTAPNGNTYWGNNGMSNANWTTAGGSADTINTVENVFVQNPASGTWTVEVIGSDINTDAVPNTPDVDADYGLVLNGVIPAILVDTFSTSVGSHLSGAASDLSLSDNSPVVLGRDTSADTADDARWITVNGTSPVTSPTELSMRVESRTQGITTGRLSIQFFDFANNAWVTVANNQAVGTTDAVVVGVGSGTLSRFVQVGTRTVRARVTWWNSNFGADADWTARPDQIRWLFSP
jgi:hypothetical protein